MDDTAAATADLEPSVPPGEPPWEYAAFISYKTSSSARAARRLDRGLRAVARRHPGHPDFNLFLDASSLRAGPLRGGLVEELGRSRCLVVVLHRETVASDWVREEITQWLATVGSPDRIFLVKADPAVDLTWDAAENRYAHPEHLPEPLRGLFTTEQVWIEFLDRRSGYTESDLARLCAAILDADAEEFFLEEARFQRRQRRRLGGVVAAMTVLLAVTLVAALVAISSRDRAERDRRLAVAQADAAEAILAAEGSPVLGIEAAIRASLRSDSPTVRSSMLAASQGARRLERALAYPEDEAGRPPRAAAFDRDGTSLLAWGPTGSDRTSFLQIWDVGNGRAEFSGVVDTPGLEEVVGVNGETVVGCGRDGPVTVTLAGNEARASALDPGWAAGTRPVCLVDGFAGGAVVLAAPDVEVGRPEGRGYYVDSRGRLSTVADVHSMATYPTARAAVFAGEAGIVVVSPEGVQNVSPERADAAMFADTDGKFLARMESGEWALLSPGAGGFGVRRHTAPASAVAVAPLLDFGRLTDDLVWIESDGTMGWTRDDRTIRVGDSQGAAGWRHYATALEPLQSGSFVAVLGNTATIVESPTDSAEWTQTPIERRLGVADQAGRDPIVATCAERTAVIIAADSDRSVLVDSAGRSVQFQSRGQLSDTCDAIDTGTTLTANAQFSNLDPVVLRSNLVADSVVLSPSTPQVAIFRSGLPIEILSTRPSEGLPRPWDATASRGPGVAAFGETEVFIDGDDLVLAGPTGDPQRRRLPERGAIIAIRPDGAGAVWAQISPEGVRRIADAERDTIVVPGCADGTITYVPGPGFETSVAAAAAQIPVVTHDDGSVSDCRNGEVVRYPAPTEILAYDIGRRRGRIVSRADGGVAVVTTWVPGDRRSLRASPAPASSAGDADLAVDDEAGAALTRRPGSRELVVHRLAKGRWERAVTVVSGLGSVADAALVDGGTLLVVVAGTGGFELYDATSGRLLASDPTLSMAGLGEVTRIVTRIVGDNLYVSLLTAGGVTQSGVIEIPIGIDALTTQLCAVYAAPGCPA